jgi:hypothetical protein
MSHLIRRSDPMKKVALFLMAFTLFGCAAYKPVPDGYTGPVATIEDTGFSENATKAQLFVVSEIDGNKIDNALDASRDASYGQGLVLRTQLVKRQVPVRPMKLKLLATHTTGAPIHALFSQAAGSFFSVEGVVDFTPESGGRYVVKGELKKEGSSVWLEDAKTNQLVTEKVVKK